MESNLSNTDIVIKQEVEVIPDLNVEDIVSGTVDVKTEVEDTAEELYESNSLKVITTNLCENVQNQSEKTKELELATGTEMSTQKKIKRLVYKKQKNVKHKSQNTKYEDTEIANTAKKILVDEKPNNGNNSDPVKKEAKDTAEMITVIKQDAEESNSLLNQISCRRTRKSNEVLIKNENLYQNENSVGKTSKRSLKPSKITKINKSRRRSSKITAVVSNKTKMSQKNNLRKTQKIKTTEDSNKNTNGDYINLSDGSDSKESDFQEFFGTVESKKRRYRPRQKPEITEKEKAERERQKLERRTCQICNAVFALPDGLRNHIRSKHTFEKPYSCKFCGERFSTRSAHSLHRRRHHGFQPFLCNLCGKTFLQKAHMEIHMRIHIPSKDKIRDVKCSFCPNVYTSKLNLKKHILTKHTDPSEWKHECNICSKKCFSTTDLTHHMRRHNDERTYKCVICGRGFFTKQTMNVHFRTHSASTAFNCEHCSKGYRSNEALQHHMLKVHGIGEEKLVSAPKHFCPICNEGFRQRARLEKHLVIHETGEEEYPFKCEKCNKQYKARNYFTIHMLDKHKEFLDDTYFKTHFKLSTDENYANFNEALDV